MKKIYGLFALMLFLGACAADKDLSNLSVEELYNHAFDDLQETKYKAAAAGFEKVETEHPYSKWAVKAKLMGAYAYYKDEKYDDAIMALDRFIRYHPGNKDVAYAYYLKGICYYDQIAAADKDQGNTQNAEEVFSRLIMLFPDTKYAADARQKIKLTQDYRAGQEMIVGRYYLLNGNYLSALARFNVVLENYQTTVQIEEALYREVEIYAVLGMNKYADGYYKILKDNYPDGMWTIKAAEVMQKIGVQKGNKEVVVKKADKEPEEKADKGGWFDWLSFKEDESKVKADKEPVKAVKEDKAKAAEKPEEKADKGGWFDWLSFKEDKEDETRGSTLVSLWSSAAKQKQDTEPLKAEKKEIVAQPADKKEVGDILSADKKKDN